MYNRRPAGLTDTQKIILTIIRAGYSDLADIQTLAADEDIGPRDAYKAARFLRENGHVKGIKRPYTGPDRPGAPPFRWAYRPFTTAEIEARNAPVEQKLARIEATIARLKANRKEVVEAPATDDYSSDPADDEIPF